MITGAALVPATPLMIRELSGREAVLTQVREAARAAVEDLLRTGPDVVTIVGPSPAPGAWPGTARIDVRRFAPPLSPGEGADPTLPTALGVGARLLDEAGWTGAVEFLGVSDDTSPEEAARRGAELARRRRGLVVAGDGSARRGVKAPGHLDERAAGFDDDVVRALAAADAGALLALDPELARDLMVTGRAAWQVLAGALNEALRERPTQTGRRIVPFARVLHREDPLGVDLRVLTIGFTSPDDRPAGPGAG